MTNPKRSNQIYIDMDDVLCDTAGAYIEIVKEDFNKTFRLDDIFSFNLQKSFDLNDEQNAQMFKRAHRPEFTLSLKPFEKAADTLSAWQQEGHEISVVTGRHTHAYEESLRWLEMHNIPFDSFIMVDKYDWPDTDHDIAISLEELSGMSFIFAVEDNISMTDHLTTNMNTAVLLFDRPWNRSLRPSQYLRRCSSWSDISNTSRLFTASMTDDYIALKR